MRRSWGLLESVKMECIDVHTAKGKRERVCASVAFRARRWDVTCFTGFFFYRLRRSSECRLYSHESRRRITRNTL